MKKSLLYIGNRLAANGSPATTIDTLGPLLEAEGFRVRYASSQKNKIVRMLDMLCSVLLYGKRSDFVLIDTYSTLNFWYAFAVAKTCAMRNIKYIPILHGGGLPDRLNTSPKACRQLFGNAYSNVAPSSFIHKAFAERGYNRITYIPNTLPLSEYPFKLRQNFGPRLLWVRSFAAIYNPLLAILVLKQLVEKYPDAKLCMVGPDKDGSLEACKRYAHEHQLPVEFTGLLPKKEWHALSEDFDLFINTSRYDNLPVSVLEAMALGLPVISTDVGGMPYLLDDQKNARLVGNDDVEAFVSAVQKLMERPDMTQKLALSGRQKVEGFDWKHGKYSWVNLLS